MSKAGVICEFNPFHYGHKFLLQNIKSNYANDIICIMGGHFVQRGDIAICNKYIRTKAALNNGADMVVELPTVYAVSNSKIFAKNGVLIAKSLGCDMLCFGAEDSLDDLLKISDFLESSDAQNIIKEQMTNGEYYPKALYYAISKTLGEGAADISKKPNNILALEYISACKKYNIKPVAIKRAGIDHDSEKTEGIYTSASNIRKMIKNGKSYENFTPMKIENYAKLEKIESAILYKLKTASVEELKNLADISEGLENRIIKIAKSKNSINELLDTLKTKRYTHARLRRILIYALLNISNEMQHTPAPYIRVLGINKNKTYLMKSYDLPLITKVSSGYKALNLEAQKIFNIDIKASEIFSIALQDNVNISLNEFSQQIIKL